jgi:tyrosine-protein kinase Etk/Wzc
MDTPRKPVPPDDDIDITRYLSLFASNWLWIAVSLFIALSVVYLVNKYTPRIYEVKSTLLMEESGSQSSLASIDKLMPSGDYLSGGRKLGNEVIILKSHSLNYRVMEEIPDFHIAYVPLSRYGFRGERMYKSSPFIVRKLNDNQPYGVNIEIHFVGTDRYRVNFESDDIKLLEARDRKHNRGKRESFNHENVYRLGEAFNSLGFNFSVERRDSSDIEIKPDSRYLVWFESSEDLADRYRANLSVKVEKEDASVFILSFRGYAPQQAADYLNKLMELYSRQGLEWKTRAAESSMVFIDDQLGLISDSLNRVENTMERFRRHNRFVDLTLEGSLILQKLEEVEREKNTVSLQLQYYQYLLKYIDSRDESGAIISPGAMGITDPVFVGLVNHFAELQQKKKLAAYNIREDQPQVKLIEEEIENAREALHGNVLSTISQMNMAITDANQRIADVEHDLDKLPGTERELIGIQRKFDLNNSVYTFLLERRAEAGIARASQLSDNRIIDMASSRSYVRVSPNITRNYLSAFILALLIPLVTILLIDMLNTRVIDRHDIESITKTPIIGFINHSDTGEGIPVVEKPGSTLAESFRSIRTSLKFYTGQTKCPVIVVSSPVSGEGKTFISVNLAAIISMMDKKVLLVSLDLRKPRAHLMINGGVSSNTGMSSYLSNNAGFDDIIQTTGVDNLWFAPAGTPPPNPSELIGSERMKEFIARARSSFDAIIIDTPPVGLVTDAMLLSDYANVSLFIIRQRYSIKNSLRLIDEVFRRGDMKNVALVVNDISTSGYYGHGLRYSYLLGYGNKYYDPGHYTIWNKTEDTEYYKND